MLSKEKGVALVIVLFILAMMTVLATWLSDDLMLSIRRSGNLRDAEQAWQFAVGSELWGVAVLTRDAGESQTDHLGEGWNHLGGGVDVGQGQLETTIVDLQGRFNLNNLLAETKAAAPGAAPVQRIWTDAFRRLLVVLELDEGLADALLDWLDADENVRGSQGAEDSDYLGREPSYRAANRMLVDVSELQWIKGFDQEAIARLAPYVTALPATDVAININTAPAPILRILGRKILSASEAAVLAEGQLQDSAYTVDRFLQHDMMAGEQDTAAALIDDKSRYFLIQSIARYGRARLVLNSLVRRGKDDTVVIQRGQTFSR